MVLVATHEIPYGVRFIDTAKSTGDRDPREEVTWNPRVGSRRLDACLELRGPVHSIGSTCRNDGFRPICDGNAIASLASTRSHRSITGDHDRSVRFYPQITSGPGSLQCTASASYSTARTAVSSAKTEKYPARLDVTRLFTPCTLSCGMRKQHSRKRIRISARCEK